MRFTGVECFHIVVQPSPRPSPELCQQRNGFFFVSQSVQFDTGKLLTVLADSSVFTEKVQLVVKCCGHWVSLRCSPPHGQSCLRLRTAPSVKLHTPSLGTGRLRCPLLPSLPTSAPPAFSVPCICSFLSHAFELFFKVALSCLIHLRPSPSILPRSCSQ